MIMLSNEEYFNEIFYSLGPPASANTYQRSSFNPAFSRPFNPDRRPAFNGGTRGGKKRRATVQMQKAKQPVDKVWIKDVILLPSPRMTSVPKGAARETLYNDGFVISGFKLHSTASEKDLITAMESQFVQTFSLSSRVIKFTFVRAVEKKIVPIKNGEEINGEVLKHVSGSRDRPIYIRATEDLTHYISNQGALEIEDDLPDIPDVELPPFSSLLGEDEANYIDMEPLTEDHVGAGEVEISRSDTSTRCRSVPVIEVPEETGSQICPVCQHSFPISEIVQHASLCIEARAGPSTLEETTRARPSTLDGYFTEEQPHKSLRSELSKKREKYVRGQHPVKFVIRRSNVVRDVMKKMAIFFSEDPIKPITVEFVGEEAVDEGGPLRELFTAFYDEVPQVLMQGNEKNYTFQHDLHKLEKKWYGLYGKFMALGFMNGFAGPHNFCQPLAQYVLSGDAPICEVSDVPCFEVKTKLEEVVNATTQEDLDAVMTNFDERFEAGYNKAVILLKDKADLVGKLSKYWVLTRQLEEIQQFMNGLSANGILDALKKHTEESTKELVYEISHLTSKAIQEMFQAEYTKNPSEEQQKAEQDIVYNWCNFLDELEQGMVPTAKKTDFLAMSEEIRIIHMKLEDVLFFLTGSKFLPPLSLGKGKLTFCSEQKKRVTVSTCTLKVTFPLDERYKGENFTANIIEDIIASPGFGSV